VVLCVLAQALTASFRARLGPPTPPSPPIPSNAASCKPPARSSTATRPSPSASTDAPTHPSSAKQTSPPTPPSPGGATAGSASSSHDPRGLISCVEIGVSPSPVRCRISWMSSIGVGPSGQYHSGVTRTGVAGLEPAGTEGMSCPIVPWAAGRDLLAGEARDDVHRDSAA
jgi:hypothetical protein